MKFLLINPLLENIDPERTSSFPVGLAYIGRVVLSAGHKVEVFDIQLSGYDQKKVEEKIKNFDADVFLMTGLITTFNYVIWLSTVIKKYHPGKKIIMGGALATTATRILMENTAVDIAVIDEGEITTFDLIEFLEGKKEPEDIKGIWYKNEQGKIIENYPQERIKNLDLIDFPAWEIFETEKYLNTPVPMIPEGLGIKKRWIYVSTSRGCPFSCNFCSKVFGRKVYLRSAENIISEINILIDRYNIEHINFCDDLFMTSRARVLKFCDLVKKLDKKITWTASSRVDTLDETLLEEMRKAGCLSLGLGIESGSQKILNKMQKRTTPQIAARAIQMIKKSGIYPHCSFMIGMLGETEETIKETVDFIKRTDIFPQGLVFTTALPRSELYREALQKGFIKDEVEYLKKMNSTFIDHYVVNFSTLSEERIIELKHKYDGELRMNYMLHHPVWTAKNMLKHLKVYGAGESLKRFKRKISSGRDKK
jgi:radical SAM superfamily enzyme YgiQ (UPF0313 family)